MLLDVIASIAVLGAVALIYAAAASGHAAGREDAEARRLARMAGMAQLERWRVSGAPQASGTLQFEDSDQSGVKFDATFGAGEGAWAGLVAVELKSTRATSGGAVTVVLSAYVPATESDR